jgi:phosphatidylserine decarboxylase
MQAGAGWAFDSVIMPSRMPSEPVTFYNRHTGAVETEVIYGEPFLRWVYENPLGRFTLWALVKRSFFSQWYGWRMDRPASRAKIAPFIQTYGINTGEMLEAPERFPHFNAFFSRKLKAVARPIAPEPNRIVFPADGRHLVIPEISQNDGLFIKGMRFNLAELLRDQALSDRYAHGGMLISRLCPVDYHRFHFACGGLPDDPRLINGPLYSVNPIALRKRPSILWENKRYVTRVAETSCGEVLQLEIGATCVGTACQTYTPGKPLLKGDEKGYFLFGGSCTITIFEPNRVRFDADLIEHSAQGREVYAWMGEGAGSLV